MGTAKRWIAMSAAAATAAAAVVFGAAAPAAAVAPAGTPTLRAPAADATVAENPTFQWSAVPGAVKYRIQVSRSTAFTTLVYNLDTYGLSATPTSDLPLGTLYWRVAATDGGAGVGPYGLAQFTKNPSRGPILAAPANHSVLTYPAQPPILRWSALSGVKSYKVELDDANDFIGARAFSTTNTALALTEPLILGKSYYWRVQGVSATTGVTGAFSAAWTFQMAWPETTGKPLLSAPANDTAAGITDVVFRWQPVLGAKNYQIQVSPNPEFANNITDDRIVAGTQYSPATTYNNATYFWRVRALDTGSTQHQGPWSDAWQFKREWTARPTLKFPINGTRTDAMRFAWDGIEHASYYQFQVSSDINFSDVNPTICGTFGTSFTPHQVTVAGHVAQYPPGAGTIPARTCSFNLAAGGHYYWRVRGADTPGNVYSVWSDAQHFFYEPAVPAMTAPADGASTSAPVLRWTPIQGYARYKVVVSSAAGSITATTYGTSYTPTKSLAAGQYSWYVVGIDPHGALGRAPGTPWRFTLTAPVGGASLGTPRVDQSSALTVPSMSWEPLTGASYYKVWLAPRGGGSVTDLSSGYKLAYPAFTATTTPLDAGWYSWLVRAYNAGGVEIGSAQGPDFEILDLAYATYLNPATCTLASCPAPEQSTPELSWNPVPGAASYRVWLALDRDFTNVVRRYTTRHTTLPPRETLRDNEAGQSYYWFVQPCRLWDDACGPFAGPSLVDHEQAFRKQSRPVTLISPANSLAALQMDVVSFSWSDYTATTAGLTGVKQYRLQVASDPSFTTIVDSVLVDQPGYQAWTKAYPDGVYYWRVQAIDGGDLPLTYSAVWTFQKSSRNPVVTSTPTSAGLPTLTWGAQPYASGYTVEIYRGTSGLFPLENRVLVDSSKLPSFTPRDALAAGTYSWRVRKLNPSGHPGRWSAGVPTFTVARVAATLALPVELARIRTNSLFFTWFAVSGAAAYRFESSPSASFSPLTEQVSTVMTRWAPAVRYADGPTYYWRVRVLDAGGNVLSTSTARRFTKDSQAPAVTAVTPTTGLAIDGQLTVTFSEPVKGISAAGLVLRLAGTTTVAAGTVTPTTISTLTTTATYRPRTPLIPGQRYELIVGGAITDVIGNPVVRRTVPVRTALTIENTSPALIERWDVDTATVASGGKYISSATAGASATFRFTGPAVTVLGRTSSLGGEADVFLDGVRQPARISFYSPTTTFGAAVFARTGLANQTHTLTIQVSGTKPAGSRGTFVEVDAFIANLTYQEDSPSVTTAFARTASSLASGGSHDVTAQERDLFRRAEYQFRFRGTGLTLTGTRLPSGGVADVIIDGATVGSINYYSSAARYKMTLFRSATLADRVHTVRIIPRGVGSTGSSGTDVVFDVATAS